MALLSNLHFAIFESVALRPAVSSSEYGRQLLISVINLFENIFVDGRCGKWHWEIGRMYLTLCHYEAEHNGKIENILAHFDKGFDHCKEYKRILSEEEYKYSAPLVSNLKSITKGDIAPLEEDFWKKELRNFPKDICDELRKNEKYAECFA